MTDKYESPYADPPEEVEETDEESDPSPDNGRDLSNMVPEVEVAWEDPPSFNTDPTDLSSDGGSEESDEVETSGDLRIDLASMRTAETSMLTEANGAVTKYEELRTLVASVKDTVFGQEATETKESGGGYNSLSGYTSPEKTTSEHPFAEAAGKFAAEMNPAQERALLQVGSALNKLGEYIALLNHSGQLYAETDRLSRFPAPPEKG